MTVDPALVSVAQAPPVPSVRERPRPLSQAQAGLWYAQRLDPANPVFNTAHYVEITGDLDEAALAAAVRQAALEADALAVRVLEIDGEPYQVVDEACRATLDVIDLRGQGREAAHAAMAADLGTPLDLTWQPAGRQVLYRLDGCFFWYQRFHHLVIDGYGTALLTARIADLYSAAITGRPAQTAPFAPFDPVLDADRAYQESNKRATDRDFWRDQLADAPPAPGLANRTALTAHHYRRTAIDLAPGTGAALRRLAAEAGIQWPDAVAALVAAYVGRHAGRLDVTVGAAAMERLGTAAARVPAMVMNVLPLRVRVDEERPLVEWLREVSGAVRKARRHGRYRHEHIRRDLGMLGGDRRLYGVLINVLPFGAPVALAHATTGLHVLATGPVDDLTVTVRADASLETLRAELDGNPLLYDDRELAAHAARLAAFLERAAASPRLAEVPTVTAAECDRILREFNDTAHAVESTTLSALIARTCAAVPDRPAVAFAGRTMTYAELDGDVTRVAAGLRAAGVRRGDVVGVALPRSIDLIVAIYAIVRAGGAYLPLDVDQPVARLARILESAAPRLVVATGETGKRLPPGVAVLSVDEARATSSVDGPVEGPGPGDAAYVIFTSGSTGEPKGVVVDHAAIVNRLLWMREHYLVGADDVLLQKTPVTFDVSVWELFLAAVSGATLAVAPPESHRDPRWIGEVIREHGATIVHFVPSMLAEWLDEPSAAAGRLRAVICSGEALPALLRDRFHERFAVELHNLYGPTEAAVDVSYWACGRTDRSDPVPIGQPVWNTRLYVVDDRDRLLPPGAAGHLCLAGVQLARGYLGRPDLTAERFVADPFAAPGERMYRTGDLARWRDDGAVEFLGRSDDQVKIRGQRIELGEIETAIVAEAAVVRAVVMVRGAGSHARLVAYVQPAGGSLDVQALRQAVGRRLPDVMVPAAFVAVSVWPSTPNGKLDRARLPEPADAAGEAAAPATATERRVARTFAEVLKIDERMVSREADFFTLGGHSLLAAQVVRRLRVEYGEGLELSALFLHPTVSALSELLDAAAGSAGAGSAGATDTAPLIRLGAGTGAATLFCVHPAGGLSWCYTGLARLLPEWLAVYGLQARGLAAERELPASLDALADDYVLQMKSVQPEGPYHLLGWSIGGIIAQAMAARIEAGGGEVGLLAMLDAYPSDRWRGGTEPTEAMALRALLLMAGEHQDDRDAALTRAAVIARLRAGHHPLGMLSDSALSGVLRVVRHNNGLVRRHVHAPCRATLVHIAAQREHRDDGVSPEEWRPYVGTIDRHGLPVLHAHMTAAPAVENVAAIVRSKLES